MMHGTTNIKFRQNVGPF